MRKGKRPGSDRIFDAVNGGILGLVALICLYPILFVCSASISDPTLVNTGGVVLLPHGLQWEGYKMVFEYHEIWIGYRNTILYTVSGTLVNLVLTLMTAYALSRRDLVGRNFFTLMFSFTMYFSGGLIPTFLVVKNLNLVDNPLVLVILGAISMWNVIITRTYFSSSIPAGLEEAGQLDGCCDAQLFMHVVLPLSAPIIAVMALYYAVGHWNNYFNALIYLNTRDYMPLQLFLREILIENQTTNMIAGDTDAMIDAAERARTAQIMKYCLIVVSSLPVLLIYPFIQRYFVKGVMIGAIKE